MSISTDFSQRYGIYAFPILADLALYTLMSQITSRALAHMTGLIAAAGVGYLLVDRTNLLPAMIAAGIYLAYKVALYFYTTSGQSAAKPVDLEQAVTEVEESYNELQKFFFSTIDTQLDLADPEFKTKFQSELKEIRKHDSWGILAFRVTSILKQCQTILFQTLDAVEAKTEGMGNIRLKVMRQLLKTSSSCPPHVFGQALVIFFRTYRAYSRKGCNVLLPNLQNASENQKTFLILEESEKIPTPIDQEEISKIFQETNQRLKGIIGIICSESEANKNGDVQCMLDVYQTAPPHWVITPPPVVAAEQLGL